MEVDLAPANSGERGDPASHHCHRPEARSGRPAAPRDAWEERRRRERMETKEGKPWSPITGKVAVSLVATVAGFAREKPWLQPRHQRAPRWSSRQTGPRRPPPPPPSPCHQSSPSEGPRTPARWGGRTIELARSGRRGGSPAQRPW